MIKRIFFVLGASCFVLTSHAWAQVENLTSQVPASWQRAYDRLNCFIQSKQELWSNSHISISREGKLDFSMRNEKDVMQLGVDINEFGARGSGWKRSRILKSSSDSFNSGNLRLNPGIYSATITSKTSLHYQFHDPILWFEVTFADEVSASRKSKSDRLFREIPPPKEPSKLWPNQRINAFIDLATLAERRNRMGLLSENKVVEPSTSLRIRNDGVLEREVFSEFQYESVLCWQLYKNNELIVQRPATNETEWKIDTGYGSYRALLCIEGPNGILPVSNILEFPLFPFGEGQLRCIPVDKNKNKLPDVLEKTDSESQKHQELQALWKSWSWRLQPKGTLAIESVETMWLQVSPAPYSAGDTSDR